MRTYEIRFTTKRGGERHWVKHVDADNAREARKIAEDRWNAIHRATKPHMFGVTVRLATPGLDVIYRVFTEV